MTVTSSIQEKLIGVWRLVSYEARDIYGNLSFPLGKDATGFIMYHSGGYMSVQIMSSGRPKYTTGDLYTGTQEEMATAAHGYLAYAGPYQVDENTETLIHHVVVSLNPIWQDSYQERYPKFEDNQLELKGPLSNINGVEQYACLIWERVE